jgi:2'-5' RNA ligase
VRERLAVEVERLRPLARDVAWVARDNVHLTCKFLGGVEAARLDAITAALGAAAAGIEPFDLVVRGLGAFPSPTRPRVLWAGIGEGETEAARLAGRVDEALAGLGFPRDDRPFAGHVTLGRVREPKSNPGLAEGLRGGIVYGSVRVDHVCLMRSELSPRGARYSELAAIPLGPR